MRERKWVGLVVYVGFLVLCAEIALQLYYRVTAGAFLFTRVAQPLWAPNPHSVFFNKPDLDVDHRTNEFSAHYITNSRGLRVPRAGLEHEPGREPEQRVALFQLWETKTDGTPDCDHGAVSANALQSMLLQSDGRRIFLLPAWPEDWDVTFKLWAADNTTVECTFRDGRVQSLEVTPESRLADIVDMTTPAQRIRTLVEVALADHNYLFGLPPMLDAQPIPGKVTGPWIEQYGHTIQGCKAGPWAQQPLLRQGRVRACS